MIDIMSFYFQWDIDFLGSRQFLIVTCIMNNTTILHGKEKKVMSSYVLLSGFL